MMTGAQLSIFSFSFYNSRHFKADSHNTDNSDQSIQTVLLKVKLLLAQIACGSILAGQPVSG